MGLVDVTDPTAVDAALTEYDQIGRDAFLKKYGFGRARSYFLKSKGRLYDSKAVVGAAHGFQHGEPLRNKDFSGGEATVARILRSLGFEIEYGFREPLDLIPHEIYRRTELHARFGGQRQGGISTPTDSNVIMVFTGASGPQHGYEDGWSNEIFCYFGEGQEGDMEWLRGNAAIRDHIKNGRDLLLFEMLQKPRSHVRYLGEFSCSSWEIRDFPNRMKVIRKAIVFHLVPLSVSVGAYAFNGEKLDLTALRNAAAEAGSDTPARSVQQAIKNYIDRSAVIRDYALARAQGHCECCLNAAPFARITGEPYLEVHHIRRLSDGGPDRLDAVAAICPNCHREAHHGQARVDLNNRLLSAIQAKEAR